MLKHIILTNHRYLFECVLEVEKGSETIQKEGESNNFLLLDEDLFIQ